jgi:four helix bundle protein
MQTFTYRDLVVWKLAMTLVEACYRATSGFPVEERYGLTNQIRRAALSIPLNVAEGRCRHTTNAFINHVSIALGSVGELETCIDLCVRLGFLKPGEARQLMQQVQSVGRLLNGLHTALQKRRRKQRGAKACPQSPVPSPQSPAPSP